MQWFMVDIRVGCGALMYGLPLPQSQREKELAAREAEIARQRAALEVCSALLFGQNFRNLFLYGIFVRGKKKLRITWAQRCPRLDERVTIASYSNEINTSLLRYPCRRESVSWNARRRVLRGGYKTSPTGHRSRRGCPCPSSPGTTTTSRKRSH
jgi:hypothetical protein